MRPMNDKFFLDSNVILYTLDKDESKKEKAKSLLRNSPFISPQVVFECLNIAIKKFKMTKNDALDFSRLLIKYSALKEETKDVVLDALILFNKYQLQVFDSKIISSALHADCIILYSEDMQNGLVIENRLTIVNFFL
jgi:predicted nucleic acid-binding protein